MLLEASHLAFALSPARNKLRLLVQETVKIDELRCNPFSARIVYLFSEDGSGELTFQRFINMFSVFSGRTSRQTKAVWAFALWDFDGIFQLHVSI